MSAEQRRLSAARRTHSWPRRLDVTRGLATSVLAAIALAACSSGESTDPQPGLGVTPHDVSVAVGASTQFSALNASGAVTWTSSNDNMASILSTGFATAKAPGVVTITAQDSRGSATATLTIRRPATLVLSSQALTFTAAGAGPADQTIQVTDGGDDKVGALSVASITYAQGQPGGWLTATLSGTAAPAQLTVHAAPAGLAPGTYGATISVAAVGATNGAQSVAVQFTVIAGTSITLSSNALTFGLVRGQAGPAAQTVNVANGGGGVLNQLSATIAYQAGQPTGWLTATLAGSTAPTTLTVQPSLGALADGTYNAIITVGTTINGVLSKQVAVSFTIGTGPAIGLSGTTANFAADIGGPNPAQQTFQVTNIGGGTLAGLTVGVTYANGQPGGWLTTATLSPQTAPATVTLRPTVGGLVAGTYNATVTIASPLATNSPRTIAVTFTVSQQATIVLGSNALNLTQAAGSISAPIAVSVSRGGGGVLTNLTAGVTFQSGAAWLTANLQSTSTPTNVVLTVNTTALAVGAYQATVSIASIGASNSPQTIVVNLNVVWSFASDVYPLFDAGSLCKNCHFAGGNLPDLSSPTLFYNNLVNVSTTGGGVYPLAVTHNKRIVPGSASTSYVIDQIKKLAGAHAMPTGAATVPASTIQRLTEWINQGAPLP